MYVRVCDQTERQQDEIESELTTLEEFHMCSRHSLVTTKSEWLENGLRNV